MKILPLAASFLLLAGHAGAADALAPVAAIMQATEANWAGTDGPGRDLFGPDMLASTYSRDFVSRYETAAKFPAYDGGDSPFDYDVIVNGQDGCSLRDIKTEAAAPTGGVTVVTVTFDNSHCFGERAADWRPAQVIFKVIEENGKAVVDDIMRPGPDGDGSLKAEMEAIASQ